MNWLADHKTDCVVNPVVLGEIQFGILAMPNSRRRQRLVVWFENAVRALRVLDVDAGTAATWAQLLAKLRRQGRTMPIKDSLIAATSLQHNLVVATWNTTDYLHAGVDLVNPFNIGD